MKSRGRANEIFAEARKQIQADYKAIKVKHTTNSDAITSALASSFDEHSNQALQQILDETANRIDHRGCKWRSEMKVVEHALNEYITSAPNFLLPLVLVDNLGANLPRQFSAFRDGWTSPRSRPWHERHAVLYAILLLVAGALVEPVGSIIVKYFS